MDGKIECSAHGEGVETFVCVHLTGESTGLGFNRNEPAEDNPYPDAWCDDCELIRVASDGWNEESEKLCQIKMICSGCYERARICNTKATISLDDLADLRWKCGGCDEWHHGPCLDFGYDQPYYWGDEEEKIAKKLRLLPKWVRSRAKTFITDDVCVIEDNGYFVRGVIHLPIIGCAETFRWGVWGSLSEENFKQLRAVWDHDDRAKLPHMFSWLSSQIPEYPDTLNLKMKAVIHEPSERPSFRLEPTDHPLSLEYHHGITADRVKEIMLNRLGEVAT